MEDLEKTLPPIEIQQGKGAYSLDVYCSIRAEYI
jgi:hypothetical protein